MTSNRPYHHGNLRRELLDQAALVLREQGAAALSLRELARELGVSHAAPSRHFPDRQALLDALVVEGIARLGDQLQQALAGQPGFPDQVRALAGAYVDFATEDANLLELLFTRKQGGLDETREHCAADAFASTVDVFCQGQAEGMLPDGDPARMGLIFLATLQGIAAMVNAGLVPTDQLHELIDDAVAGFLPGAVTSNSA